MYKSVAKTAFAGIAASIMISTTPISEVYLYSQSSSLQKIPVQTTYTGPFTLSFRYRRLNDLTFLFPGIRGLNEKECEGHRRALQRMSRKTNLYLG